MPVDLSTIHVNRALTSMSVLLNNDLDTYLYSRICARRGVDAMSDNFFRYGREPATISDAAGQSNARFLPSLTADGTEAPRRGHEVTLGTYQAHRYALRELVTDRDISIADDPLSPLKDAGAILADQIRNDAEAIVAATVCTYANYPAGNRVQLTTGANGTSWNKASAAGTGSNPLNDIRTGRIALEQSIQRPATDLAMSAITKYHLSDHDVLKGILQYTDDNIVSGEGIPPEIRGLRIGTGRAVANTAKEGAAYSGAYLFGDQSEATAANRPCAIICYLPPTRTIGPRGFSSFIWFDCPDQTTHQRGVSIRAYRDDAKGGWWVEAAITLDVQPGIVDANGLITGAYLISRAAIP